MKPQTSQIEKTANGLAAHIKSILTLCEVVQAKNGVMYISQDKARQIANIMLAVVPGCQTNGHNYTWQQYAVDVDGFGQLRLTFNPRYEWKQGASLTLI